jgi:hypothetical protein
LDRVDDRLPVLDVHDGVGQAAHELAIRDGAALVDRQLGYAPASLCGEGDFLDLDRAGSDERAWAAGPAQESPGAGEEREDKEHEEGTGDEPPMRRAAKTWAPGGLGSGAVGSDGRRRGTRVEHGLPGATPQCTLD